MVVQCFDLQARRFTNSITIIKKEAHKNGPKTSKETWKKTSEMPA